MGKVRVGADSLDLRLLDGKRVGLITNTSSFLSDPARLSRLVSVSKSLTLLAPEHGVSVDKGAGEKVEDQTFGGIKVISLYGGSTDPSAALEDLDVVLYDLQDVGVRYYTYISTLKRTMRVANAQGSEYYVLDRPDPLGGGVDGPILRGAFRSFVGEWEIPMRYGMTPGELANYAKVEGLVSNVVKMAGWRRAMWFDETGLPWFPPSPAIKDLETALLYSGMGLLEGTNLSEGRGTPEPFKQFGAPWLEGADEKAALDGLRRWEAQWSWPRGEGGGHALAWKKGLTCAFRLYPVKFIPSSGKYAGHSCSGFRVAVSERLGSAFLLALSVLSWAADLPEFRFLRSGEGWKIDFLAGTDDLRKAIADNDPRAYLEKWDAELSSFEETVAPYRIYPDRNR